jgi:uncharacterized membrane protein
MEAKREEGFIGGVFDIVEYLAIALEIAAVGIIIVGVIYAFVSSARSQNFSARDVFDHGEAYKHFRVRLGNTLLLGLEVLVAADVVRTTALQPTLENVAVLGVLIAIRTFLSWSLVVEIEGRVPWRKGEPT